METDFAGIQFELFLEDIDQELCKQLPALKTVRTQRRLEGFRKMAQSAMMLGFSARAVIRRYIQATIALGHDPGTDPRFREILHSEQHELDRSRKLIDLARKMSET